MAQAGPCNITSQRTNPSWTPATQPLGMLAPFFNRRGPAPAVAAVSPRKPVPAMELV